MNERSKRAPCIPANDALSATVEGPGRTTGRRRHWLRDRAAGREADPRRRLAHRALDHRRAEARGELSTPRSLAVLELEPHGGADDHRPIARPSPRRHEAMRPASTNPNAAFGIEMAGSVANPTVRRWHDHRHPQHQRRLACLGTSMAPGPRIDTGTGQGRQGEGESADIGRSRWRLATARRRTLATSSRRRQPR